MEEDEDEFRLFSSVQSRFGSDGVFNILPASKFLMQIHYHNDTPGEVGQSAS